LVIGAAAALSVSAVSIGLIVRHHIRVASDGELAPISHPAGSTAWLNPLVMVFIAAVVLLWLAGLAGLGTNSALWEVLILGFTALPLGIGVGILKYRLYEIDRIISRTLAYAIVTGLLVGVYAGLVLLATHVLAFQTPVAVAVSTLAAAARLNRRSTSCCTRRRTGLNSS